jgi:glycosyltransferase 2 family protein
VLQSTAIQVTDHLERRIRKPVDALRCVITCFWLFVIAVAAVAASATTTGVETDIVGASKRLPPTLLHAAPHIALFALFMLPLLLGGSLLVRRQVRRVVEAVATGFGAGRDRQRPAQAARRRPALLRDHHVEAGRQPRRRP